MVTAIVAPGGSAEVDAESRELLEQIAGGVTIFEPRRRTSQELTRFQQLARLLLRLERGGLIHHCYTVEQEIAGVKYFDRVHIPRGLTPQGEEVCRAASRAAL